MVKIIPEISNKFQTSCRSLEITSFLFGELENFKSKRNQRVNNSNDDSSKIKAFQPLFLQYQFLSILVQREISQEEAEKDDKGHKSYEKDPVEENVPDVLNAHSYRFKVENVLVFSRGERFYEIKYAVFCE